MPIQLWTKFGAVGALLVTVALYLPGLAGPFIYDDIFNLLPVIEWAQDRRDVLEVLLGNPSGPTGRPLSILSFMLSATSGVEPYYFKLGNLLIHLVCGVAIAAVSFRVACIVKMPRDQASVVAMLVAAIWLVHPLNVSTVLYSVQRMTQLAALFSLLAILCFIKGIELANNRQKRWFDWLFVAFPVALALGILSKENAAVTPLLCLVLWVFAFPSELRKQASGRWFFAIFLLIPGCVVAIRILQNPSSLLSGFISRDFTLWERALTQPRVLVDYISQTFVPNVARMGVFQDDFSLSTGLLNPVCTILAIIALSVVTVLAIRLRHRHPLVCVGWLFFLAAHAVESTILPLDIYYEHRNYLPLVGLLVAVAGTAVPAIFNLSDATKLRLPLSALTALFLIATVSATHSAVSTWRSVDSLLENAVRTHPNSLRAQITKALHHVDARRIDQAQTLLSSLQASGNGQFRRVADLFMLAIQCRSGQKIAQSIITRRLRDAPTSISMNDLQAINFLLTSSRNNACIDLDEGTLGAFISSLADAATLQADGNGLKQQTRYAAALVYARSNQWDKALPQAKLAWQSGAKIEVGALYGRALVLNGFHSEAANVISTLNDQVASWDWRGQQQIMMLNRVLNAVDKPMPQAPLDDTKLDK